VPSTFSVKSLNGVRAAAALAYNSSKAFYPSFPAFVAAFCANLRLSGFKKKSVIASLLANSSVNPNNF
jgi:hypothetical protein